MKIAANMVVRNEANNYLPQVLDRLAKQVDYIVLTDDCSDDGTADLAESKGARVQRLDRPLFREHEGSLRQKSWEWFESNIEDPDTLVLAIDADEELYETGPKLSFLATLKNFNVFNVTFFHMWNENQFRMDGGWRPHPSSRLFRYKPGGQFQQRKLACGSEPTYVQDFIRKFEYMTNTGLAMKHLSYIKDEDKKIKYQRYVELDGGEFHAGAHIKSIVDPPEKVALDEWGWDAL